MERIGFIGVGKVGTAFGVRLSEQGFPVVAAMDIVPSESRRFADSVPGCRIYDSAQELADETDFVFITTPDDVISKVAAGVSWRRGQSVVHCSGANSAAILEPARHVGAHVGCMHPCNTFASIAQSLENLPECRGICTWSDIHNDKTGSFFRIPQGKLHCRFPSHRMA